MGPATQTAMTLHDRPAEGEAHELVGFENVLTWLRIVGVAVILSQAPAYRLLDPLLVVAVAALALGTAVAGHLAIRDDLSLPEIRRRGRLLLASDVLAVYLVGTAFVPDPHWLGFYFYPLISLEATLIAGTAAGLAVTAFSLVVYGAQAVLHVSLGSPIEPREAVGAVALIGMTGGFLSVFGLLAERGRRDLRVLLDLTQALAQQEDEADTIPLLDQRFHDAVGGRVRSIVLVHEDGDAEIVHWRSPERQSVERADIEAGLELTGTLAATFEAGRSLTFPTDAWSVVTATLGLPEWSRSVTLVPIFSDRRWVGILPVLWPVAKTPDRHELRLLYGLAGHVGLALVQRELREMRAEAATDPLTGLLNRRAIGDELAMFVARAGRAEGRVGVLFLDLDGFKLVNDQRGHEAGDAVLECVAGAVRSALRQGDVVGRYGGDEMLVVAADAGGGEATALARRIRAAVRAAAGEDGVDVTIGIAIFPDAGRTEADLMAAADQAMYRGKLRGPGHIVVADGAPQDTATSV